MRIIKIFLASSSELKEDREKFRTFISVENDKLTKQDIYIEVVQWEFFLDSISDTRLQNEYNNAIRQCDIVLCLFHTKVGKYTAEEFDTAYETFKKDGKPRIWTYFKAAHVPADPSKDTINTLLKFKQKLIKLGHFYTSYTNSDNLLLHFKRQLELYLGDFNAIVPDEKQPKVSKEEILSLIDFDIDSAFNELDKVFLNKNALYNDLCKEYIAQPNNFSIEKYRSKLKRFATMNLH